MNSFVTLRSTFQCLDDGLSQLSEVVSEKQLVSLSDHMIRFAEDLKAQKAERIKDLVVNGPRIFYEMGELVVVLLREREEKYFCLRGRLIELDSTKDEAVRERYRLNDPADEDGQTYFLKVLPTEYEKWEYGIYVKKAEWLTLKEKFAKAKLEEFGNM